MNWKEVFGFDKEANEKVFGKPITLKTLGVEVKEVIGLFVKIIKRIKT